MSDKEIKDINILVEKIMGRNIIEEKRKNKGYYIPKELEQQFAVQCVYMNERKGKVLETAISDYYNAYRDGKVVLDKTIETGYEVTNYRILKKYSDMVNELASQSLECKKSDIVINAISYFLKKNSL